MDLPRLDAIESGFALPESCQNHLRERVAFFAAD
jgi:hypothetical protein